LKNLSLTVSCFN